MISVYLLTSPQLPGKFKAGISNDVYRRMGEIAEQLAHEMGRDVTINKEMALPMLLPERSEKWIHKTLSAFRAKVPYHSGHTEWFHCRNFWAVLLWLVALWFFGLKLTLPRLAITAVLYYARYPLDGALLLLLAFFAQFGVAVGVVVAAIYYFF